MTDSRISYRAVFVKRPDLFRGENHLTYQTIVNLVLEFVLNKWNMLNEKILESSILPAVKSKLDNCLSYNRILYKLHRASIPYPLKVIKFDIFRNILCGEGIGHALQALQAN